VANIPRAFPNDGTLILVDTSVALGVILESIIPDSKFIFGSTSKPKRRKVISQFESRELKCLIGSKILKRGLDLKGGCENLVIIGGGAKWSEFDQKVGRAVRLNERGWSRVFSFMFFNNKYLYKHSKENLKAAIDMGYPTKVIVNDRELDGANFIRSQFRIPK
jgi:superfamily II DNA or RNA helicase